MTVYLDLYFAINFVFNYIILCITKKILGYDRKILCGTFIATVFSFLYLYADYFLLKIIYPLIIVLITFGINKFIYSVITFLLVSFAFGGCLYTVFGLINYNYNKVKFLFLIMICTLFCFILLNIFCGFYKNFLVKIKGKRELVIEYNNSVAKIYGVIDTCNSLSDPYFNLPVIVADKLKIKELISDNGSFFLVPFSSVGTKSGLMRCFLPDRVLLSGKEINCVIGISETKLSCDGLINPSLILQEV
ncbi:MAG: sigma-E processing peptidase SpoIIGA [Clostridia bacterium]|nr:sigma-E processing peptidase SpoIIGA [Clostridia bacterium]